MINTIISAISKALSTAFEDCEIYKNPTEQNAVDNSFFVQHNQTVTSGRASGAREYRHLFSVTYYPPTENENTLMNEVAMKLVPLLETLKISDEWSMHGFSLTCTKSEHLLSTTVEYRTMNIEEADGEPLEKSEIEIIAKEV